MAAKAKVTSVTACEVTMRGTTHRKQILEFFLKTFQPMAQCAESVITHNECDGLIRLIPKRSTDILVEPSGDMSHKANVLVTEVFDTELIGEGAIGTFNHAHKSLLSVSFQITI